MANQNQNCDCVAYPPYVRGPVGGFGGGGGGGGGGLICPYEDDPVIQRIDLDSVVIDDDVTISPGCHFSNAVTLPYISGTLHDFIQDLIDALMVFADGQVISVTRVDNSIIFEYNGHTWIDGSNNVHDCCEVVFSAVINSTAYNYVVYSYNLTPCCHLIPCEEYNGGFNEVIVRINFNSLLGTGIYVVDLFQLDANFGYCGVLNPTSFNLDTTSHVDMVNSINAWVVFPLILGYNIPTMPTMVDGVLTIIFNLSVEGCCGSSFYYTISKGMSTIMLEAEKECCDSFVRRCATFNMSTASQIGDSWGIDFSIAFCGITSEILIDYVRQFPDIDDDLEAYGQFVLANIYGVLSYSVDTITHRITFCFRDGEPGIPCCTIPYEIPYHVNGTLVTINTTAPINCAP